MNNSKQAKDMSEGCLYNNSYDNYKRKNARTTTDDFYFFSTERRFQRIDSCTITYDLYSQHHTAAVA